MIEAVEDPTDSRRKIMFLTKEGNALAKRLLAILDGENSADYDSPSATEALAKIRKRMGGH